MLLENPDPSSVSRCSPSVRAAVTLALLALVAACSGSGSPATGVTADVLPPRLSGAVQNRSVDPHGATLDLDFDEPMDPESVEDVVHYTASNGAAPLWAALLANGTRLRVFFDEPLLPGATTLAVDGVLDLAGNPSAPVAFFPITSDDVQPPVPGTAGATSWPGASNDRIELVFDDDLVPAEATDPDRFYFEHPVGTLHLLDGASIRYELESRTIVIDLAAGGSAALNLQTGIEWSLTLDAIRDLGGNSLAPGTVVSGVVTGDAQAPVVLGATQNLSVDAGGHVVDLAFSEVVGSDLATALATWSASNGQSVVDASLLWPGDVVRVAFDAPVLPGADTLALENVFDLAGNQLAALPAQAITPADDVPPGLIAVVATTVSGFQNDTLSVTFSEPVMASDATDLARFALFQGAQLDLVGSAITYDADLRTTTITLQDLDLATGSVFALTCAGVRDLAGNLIAGGAGQFGVVTGDAVAPATTSAQQNTLFDPFGRTIDLAFDEPVPLEPLPTFTASGGFVPIASQALGGSTGVRLVFAVPLTPGTSTVEVAGLRDPAGNTSATATIALATADVTGPALLAANVSTITGVANDYATATFDEQVVPAQAVNPASWTLESPIGTAVSLAGASFLYDASTRTVSITLPLDTNLATGASYFLAANGIDDVAGNLIGAVANFSGTVSGDAIAPTVVVADRNQTADSGSRTVDVTFSEAVSAATAQAVANFDLSGTPNTHSATLLLDGRTVRLYTSAAVTPGTTTIAIMGVRDLASNLMTPLAAVAITN